MSQVNQSGVSKTYPLCKSSAGRDKGSWYAIIRREPGFVYIADGRRRKVESPKRKNEKHVEITRKTIELCYFTDKSLRKSLWKYNFGNSENSGDFKSDEMLLSKEGETDGKR
ncbi:MAG: KOW domain-containing RNA-binding protein [Oscillospiraceae bacterium]|nr:KOW domain-containing RNA-binding protein [Oscillospiraceae bacterium]